MGTRARRLPLIPGILKIQLTVQEKLEARIQLMSALQLSQDPSQVLQHFFRHIQPLVNVAGLGFSFAKVRMDVRFGRDGIHRCDYRLTAEEEYLGEIIFSRGRRFSEEEQASLESLLGTLICPLRNALNFQAALRLTLRDPLTELGNRAALDTALYHELQLAERHQLELSLLMIDIDHFKRINDMYGHAQGDEVLKAVAGTIQSVCRNSDLSFRYGGEEFVVILRKTDATGARIIAERVRAQIEAITIGKNGYKIHPTVSIGIGTHACGKNERPEDLFECADRALYRAKTQGRNRIMDIAS